MSFFRWFFVIFVMCLGCQARPSHRMHPFTEALLQLSAETQTQLGLTLPDLHVTWKKLTQVVAAADSARQRVPRSQAIDTLNRLLFIELGFKREVDDGSPEFMLLPAVLAQGKGNCLGLSGLYLTLTEHLSLPVSGVLVPGHFLVRYQDGAETRDVELLKGGQQMPRSWYETKYHLPKKHQLYGRALSSSETLAVFRYNLANELRNRSQYRAALMQYQKVVAVLPLYAEAQANLGLTYQLLQDYPRAEKAYQQAKTANPDLPGLAHNLKVLYQEWHIHRTQGLGAPGSL